ncbi:MAG TPA: hypothetical protein VHN37_05185 [Actinomycetota bacterium]|nr:hypothetical protein [Actinomycetota bacterium]
MRTMRRAASSILTACAAAALAAPAGAHSFTGTTAGVWHYDEEAFKGRITANVEECVSGRLVKLQGFNEDDEWETIARRRTGKHGRWRVVFEGADGTFRHVVRPTSEVTDEHEHECRRFVSGMMPL